MTTTSLPKIVQFIGTSDSGEYGNATCPHCGAKGRYVHSFLCEDGTRRAAMSGCIKLFPVSPVADEQAKIAKRATDRAKNGQQLASWDTKKLDAIEAFYRGEMTEGATVEVIRSENWKRSQWMQRRGGRR